ncbi:MULTISPECIES: exopolysaccharide biosynthesis polyprenyl glycosylphosphotransferase [unclassified Sphingomonas]|uniref:exopolysaccharide biosynthesis polyprenyl glycosylphosphotransferase n=1 Tax=unclassified Sphingomonas TaxID=196159 RepID=UPI000B140FCD|nr:MULTISPECIES: exopolysaccharide biosynthesis polyprenyl glycosylphosphotransferase [unclassified Sphingomonas]
MLKMYAELTHRPRNSLFESMRVELLVLLVLAVAAPAPLLGRYLVPGIASRPIDYAVIAAGFAVTLGVVLLRRVSAFPGTTVFGYILPSFVSSYGIALAALFLSRADYSRLYLAASFLIAVAVAFALRFHLDKTTALRFHYVTAGDMSVVDQTPEVEWIPLLSPEVPTLRRAVIVADLRHDHSDAWERMLAEAAIRGHLVYHVKQVAESLTGRVAIEHLSENSFGSLMPNLAYVKIKRVIDVIGTLFILPVLLPVLGVIALAIRLDSRGPVFFTQQRMGFRGEPFTVIKFRTMRPRDERQDRDDCVTQDEDDRITRIGRFLRRTRLDELPQAFNVLRGEMSWIGPRPEAIPLSEWYEAEIPHYRYRHIVRPGISGWAQVNQGHVADLTSVNLKLHYDFFYIKNFSAWLDLLILFRTVATVVSGFGAK